MTTWQGFDRDKCAHCGDDIVRGPGVGQREWRHGGDTLGSIKCEDGQHVATPSSPVALYEMAGDTQMVEFLTSCNSCHVNKPAPGRDICTECMEAP